MNLLRIVELDGSNCIINLSKVLYVIQVNPKLISIVFADNSYVQSKISLDEFLELTPYECLN